MKLRPTRDASLPYVALPYKTKEGAGGPLQPGFLAGFLGQSYDPFWVLNDPNQPSFEVPNLALASGLSLARMHDRRHLLDRLSTRLARRTTEPAISALDEFQQRSFDLLTSNKVQTAFQLDREPDNVRESYGRNVYGQSVLLARRLIEAGTRAVTMSWAPDANATWDTHGNNFGRDHWNSCYTIMLAGGGFKHGYVFGSSDRIGSVPASNPVSPADVIATVYHLLGVDHAYSLRDQLDRPHEIVPQGHVVKELLA
jgi:hypothetical protein